MHLRTHILLVPLYWSNSIGSVHYSTTFFLLAAQQVQRCCLGDIYRIVLRGAAKDILDITASFCDKQQVLVSAHEVAEMILCVDNILKAAPR